MLIAFLTPLCIHESERHPGHFDIAGVLTSTVGVTAPVTAVPGAAPHEAGAASGLLNATQQVGGSLGLSILTTVFGSAGEDEAKKQLPRFLAGGSAERKAEFARTRQLPAPGDTTCSPTTSTRRSSRRRPWPCSVW